MGMKYMTACYKYPYNGMPEYTFQSKWLIVIIIKTMMVRKECPIIDIQYRDNDIMDKIDRRNNNG